MNPTLTGNSQRIDAAAPTTTIPTTAQRLAETHAFMARSDPFAFAKGGLQFASPQVIATFSPSSHTLSVFGDGLANALTVGRNAAGQLLVNGGAVTIAGGRPTLANTHLIQLFGQAGDDTLTIDETFGTMPRANLFGGTGNDTITGGSGADMLFGQAGNDTLFGRGGDDFLYGGDGNDVLVGGAGFDAMFGESGDDLLVWNPGDGTDIFEGGSGNDTAQVNGGNGDETFSVTANGTRVRIDRLDPAPFSIDAGTIENFVINLGGGNDQFSATGNLAALGHFTVDGGAGNDTIRGSNGPDLLLGGDGDDFIDGQQGNDSVFLGAGNDIFQWDPGDGSDLVDGGSGTDQLLFNGSNANEVFDLSANGERVRLVRNVGNIVMDVVAVEHVDIQALGGADTVNIGDLAGTDVTRATVHLTNAVGGGDGAADTVVVHASGGGDIVDIFGSPGMVSVLGLAARVGIVGVEGAVDSLVVNGLAGDDGITATTLPSGIVRLTLDGGDGNDTLLGSQGDDVLLGGAGNDFVFGDNGNDFALLGAGDDVFQWEPGDGSDVVEGGSGIDTLRFFGSDANESFAIVAAGAGRVQLVRNVGAVVMDLNEMERIELRALGGADEVVVGDLAGTGVTHVGIDLRGSAGGGDGAADHVLVNGSNAADVIHVAGDAGGVVVSGLQARVEIFHFDGDDRLSVNGLAGDDVIDARSLRADGMRLTLNGGLGNDVLRGSDGDDVIVGGDGNDIALMGPGDDTFTWNPGDDNDTVEGGAGFDTLVFNGANVAENIHVFANGSRAVLTRNVASVTMDLDDTEVVAINALGGADHIVVDDLSGTDVAEVRINLAAANGGGDGQPDIVTLNATHGDDVVVVVGDSGGVTVLGLAALIHLTGFEPGLDRLVINLLGGDDVLEASGLRASGPLLTGHGGDGNDVLIGGDGNDTLTGGPGDDVLIGGPGLDILDGGPGDNVVIQMIGVDLTPMVYF